MGKRFASGRVEIPLGTTSCIVDVGVVLYVVLIIITLIRTRNRIGLLNTFVNRAKHNNGDRVRNTVSDSLVDENYRRGPNPVLGNQGCQYPKS